MPLVKLHTSAPVADDKRDQLLKDVSKIASEVIGKPESYVMVALSEGAGCMGGEVGSTVFADVRSIGGLSGSVNKQISERLCGLLQQTLGVAPNRIFMNFTDVPASHWGYNGSTFG
jgi:phenylpyruvate tautomerase